MADEGLAYPDQLTGPAGRSRYAVLTNHRERRDLSENVLALRGGGGAREAVVGGVDGEFTAFDVQRCRGLACVLCWPNYRACVYPNLTRSDFTGATDVGGRRPRRILLILLQVCQRVFAGFNLQERKRLGTDGRPLADAEVTPMQVV